jgi:hypothetical protein
MSITKRDDGGFRSIAAAAFAGSLMVPSFSAVASTTAPRAISHARIANANPVAVIAQLKTIKRIAYSQDLTNGDQNPYGLAYVPENNGILEKGDLLVCNFNDNFNIQGLGSTIEYIRPSESKPVAHRFIQDGRITGCEALSILPTDELLVNATYANLELGLQPTGTFTNAQNFMPSIPWAFPWGMTYAGYGIGFSYVVQQDGTLWRVNEENGKFGYTKIGYGFPVNHGVAPLTLATSGLSYDKVNDIIYFVDGDDNSLIAVSHPELIHSNGIVRTATGFSGPDASYATVLAQNGDINAPISTAVLYNGDVLVENTGDNNLLEFTGATSTAAKPGTFLARKIIDGGGPGALFGIVTVGTSLSNVVIYYNDDNENSLRSFSL